MTIATAPPPHHGSKQQGLWCEGACLEARVPNVCVCVCVATATSSNRQQRHDHRHGAITTTGGSKQQGLCV